MARDLSSTHPFPDAAPLADLTTVAAQITAAPPSSSGEMGSSGGQCDWFLIDAEDPTGGGRPVESQASMSGANGQIGSIGDGADEIQMADVFGNAGFEVCSEATSGWRRRVRIGKGPAVRDLNPNRKTALELSVRAYAEKRNGTVVKPTIGTLFDSIDEAYEFYNLYSWECGFGVRLSSSRLNVGRNKAMQEIVCACAVHVNLWL